MYYLYDINKERYDKMLDYVCKSCEMFYLVEPIVNCENFPEELPSPKDKLVDYLKERKRVTSWAGTKIKVRDKKREAVEHCYRCCKNSVDKLRSYESFFDYDNQMDIAFFKDNQCVLFAIAHEEILMVDMDFWHEFFETTSCSVTKAKGFKMIL